MTETYYALFFF